MTEPSDRSSSPETADAAAILAALPLPVICIAVGGRLTFANAAAETFFGHSHQTLCRWTLARLAGPSSPLEALADQVRDQNTLFSARDLVVSIPLGEERLVDALAAPLETAQGSVILALRERTMANRLGQPDQHRSTLRPVAGMAAMLSHEIKNPLSGIRGAAQLLEDRATQEDRALTSLIRDEVDRVSALVDRMDVFRMQTATAFEPVNIHEVLDHVRRLAAASFGLEMEIEERYDPSIPPVLGARDLLIQVFLNLIKNACEAAGDGGRIELATAYRHDLQYLGPGGRTQAHLPLEVTVTDNGPGVPADLRGSLFEPFITTKAQGSGLGLAIVAKIVTDHGATITCQSEPGATRFVTRWPRAAGRKEVRP